MFIIGFAGRAGSGKDTLADAVAKIVQEEFSTDASGPAVFKRGFAFALKVFIHDLFQYGPETPKASLTRLLHPTPLFPHQQMTYRGLLQWFGTEVCRTVAPDIWLEKMEEYLLDRPHGLLLIPDVRFPNEARWICGKGGKVILLTRNCTEEPGKHVSEQCLTLAPFSDYVLENHKQTVEESIDILYPVVMDWCQQNRTAVLQEEKAP